MDDAKPTPTETPAHDYAADTTYSEMIQQTTKDCLAKITVQSVIEPTVLEKKILNACNMQVRMYNKDHKAASERWPIAQSLKPLQIAMCLVATQGAKRVALTGLAGDPDEDAIALYAKDGTNKGTYVMSQDEVRRRARQFAPLLDIKSFSEVMTILRDIAPRCERCYERDLIAVNNGIFDFYNKILMPFDPDYVFLSKSHVDYVDNPKNPIITMPDNETWDVESWVATLTPDPEIRELLWQICGAIIRPNVAWNKTALLYSEIGNNGKGSFCELLRNLCGVGSFASIPLINFGKDFLLAPLLHASAIITDENDVGHCIDEAAKVKSVITDDYFDINIKYKTPITYKFHGFMVQCLNEFPRARDHSDTFYRRLLFVPLNAEFEGIERKYIKSDYLGRTDVLQYVLWRVLHESNDYELVIPAVCETVKDEYKEFNDPVLQFFHEIERSAVWDLLPNGFLYDCYKGWFTENQPSGKILSKYTFLRRIDLYVAKSKVFYRPDGDPSVRAQGRMDSYEPMIIEYDLKNWMNKSYTGHSPLKKAQQDTANKRYRGLQRKPGAAQTTPADASPTN